MLLKDFISPDMKIARSINLERDSGHSDLIEDYQITAKTLEILDRFASALNKERVYAWSLTGPYGMGKSAFVNYLLALTSLSNTKKAQVAWNKLRSSAPALSEKLSASLKNLLGTKGFFQVAVTAAYEPINSTLARGLQQSLAKSGLPGATELIANLEALSHEKVLDSQALYAAFQKTSQLSGRPLLIVIDEFGKNLEYMSHSHDRGDIFVVQQLAEMGSAYLWVCLHQAFGDYAFGLSMLQKQEWSKVQGRFEDISFVESTAQMLHLMQRALKQNLPADLREQVMKWAQRVHRFLKRANISYKEELDVDTIANLYPLHPLTAGALIELCVRFAQNDRTLLSFMCSHNPNALPAYLEKTKAQRTRLPAVAPDYLYDYFFNGGITAYSTRPESRKLAEIHNLITNTGDLGQHAVVIRNIGIFNLLGGTLGTRASLETIATVMQSCHGWSKKAVRESINHLMAKGHIFFREYAREYRLWEGSDFDVYQAIQEKKAKLAVGQLDQLLEEFLPLAPVVASRHALETGTIRRFERRWLRHESLTNDLRPKKGYDGLFLFCFGAPKEPAHIPEVCRDGRPLLVAYAAAWSALHGLALEVAAARSVLEDTPQLIHDSVARSEVRFRLEVAEQHFREYLGRLYSPGAPDVIWYSEGKRMEIRNSKDLSARLSDLCDKYYWKCPHIGNEMISYEHLSSAAARARRELVEAMAKRQDQERLGLQGFGPEVAVYLSLIQAKELHVQDPKSGAWRFTLAGKDPRLQHLWEQMDQCLEDAGDQGVSMADILETLQQPPFGMRMGPAPIYVCLYLLVKADEIAVFREGTYLPYLTAPEMALMIKRPELFLLKRFASDRIQQEVFGMYQELLKEVQIAGNPGLRNTTMLGVVGALIRFVERLPSYTRNTGQISLEARRLRSAIENATEPLQLLFIDIPQAVGVGVGAKPANGSPAWEELETKLRSALEELAQAYPIINTKVLETMLAAFGCHSLEELYAQAHAGLDSTTVDACDEPELKSVLKALVRSYVHPVDWAKGLAGAIAKKPLESWNDQDFTLFALKIYDYADRAQQLKTLSSVAGTSATNSTRLISITMPGGNIRREILDVSMFEDLEVKKRTDEILSLPVEKRKAILGLLAERVLAGGAEK